MEIEYVINFHELIFNCFFCFSFLEGVPTDTRMVSRKYQDRNVFSGFTIC